MVLGSVELVLVSVLVGSTTDVCFSSFGATVFVAASEVVG
ncbi:hypothetical protein B808_423 [Fructilactobacillus florum 8D]|uniref:Uncharacterized protein n=1 Tax=Fructilactobacillus florum 8D TaxID=1221538 RepID=W9EI54_9LACO|nr:hypothetical protein B808_423 [Fructilactobacillus florum 8D]